MPSKIFLLQVLYRIFFVEKYKYYVLETIKPTEVNVLHNFNLAKLHLIYQILYESEVLK